MSDDKTKADINPEDVPDIDEIIEAEEAGELSLPKVAIKPEDIFDLDKLEKFIMGDVTWAQLQGMTMDEAYGIAEYGYSMYQEGRYHDARVIFEGLIIGNPYDPYFHTMLGAVYQQLDLRDESLEEYTTAIDLDDKHLHALVNRGELLLETGQFKEALGDLKKAIEVDPQGKEEAGQRARALLVATMRALEVVKKEMAGK